ncbi:MAG: RNA-binding domain-containing protein [Patescibacteria group bacterium]
MARPLIIKEGPFVFLRNVLVMEVVAFFVFYLVSLLGHYEKIYQTFSIAHIVSFQIFLVLTLSVFQLIYLTLLFLDWYFTHFEIHEKEIIKKTGLLFRHRKTVSLADIVSVEIYQSPLSRPIFHATIILEHQSGRVTKLRNVPQFNEHVHYIKQLLPFNRNRTSEEGIFTMIERGEDQFFELKETLRHDARNGSSSKDLEKAVIKTLVGFMNAEGGTLLIGVSDDGEIKGLERDYKTLPRKDRDGFENHFSMLIKNMIGLPFAKYVRTTFETIAAAESRVTVKSGELTDLSPKEVCIVTVRESHKPAYLHNGGGHEEFYVRVGNTTQPFSMSEAEEYIKTHWK